MQTEWLELVRRLFIRRTENRVEIAVMAFDGERPDQGTAVARDRFAVDLGVWASIVLNMTAFSERPNDWHAMMNHINGVHDMLEAEKKLATIRRVLELPA